MRIHVKFLLVVLTYIFFENIRGVCTDLNIKDDNIQNEANKTELILRRQNEPNYLSANQTAHGRLVANAKQKRIMLPSKPKLTDEEIKKKYADKAPSTEKNIEKFKKPADRSGFGFGNPLDLVGKFFQSGIIGVGVHIVNIAIDIGKVIEEWIEKAESNAGFMNGILYETYYKMGEQCNVLIFNVGNWHYEALEGILYKTEVKYNDERFGLWIAQGGYFINWHYNPFGWPNMGVMGTYKTQEEGRGIYFENRPSCKPI